MKIICWFLPHCWIHIGKGLYQCIRCKTISWGANRGLDKKILTK